MPASIESFLRRPLFWVVVNLVVFSVVVFRIAHPKSADPPIPAHILQWADYYDDTMLKVGDDAPDFQLTDADVENQTGLDDLTQDQPVVLVFGSYTCPTFRSGVPELNQFYSEHKNSAAFELIYLREAHPEEDGHIPENDGIGLIQAPTNLEERGTLAKECASVLDIEMPILLDDMENNTAIDYDAWPCGVCVVNDQGRIIYYSRGSINTQELDRLFHSM